MTNLILTGARSADRRYRTARAALERSGGRLTATSTLDLLRRVRQPITRRSAAYDLRSRTVHVVMGQRYGGRMLTLGVYWESKLRPMIGSPPAPKNIVHAHPRPASDA